MTTESLAPLEKFTFRHLLQRSAETFPDKPALTFVDGEPLTYSQLAGQAEELSIFLHEKGIARGDRVALLSENMPNWVVAYFAITTMGAVVVPILTDFHATEVHHILRHSEAKAIFVSQRMYEKLHDGRFDNLELVILLDEFREIPPEIPVDKLTELLKKGSHEIVKLKEAARRMTGRLDTEVQEDDLASIIYTSGTTGRSKGVMLTHKNIVFNAAATLKIQMVTDKDRLLSVLPLSHTYECTIGMVIPLMQGATVYYLDKPPTARALLPAMEIVKPTMMLTVPLIIEKIYKMRIAPKFHSNALIRGLYRLPPVRRKLHQVAGKKLEETFGGSLHFFGIGGALLAPDVEKFLREAKFPYAIGYGLTETSPLVAGCSPTLTRYRSTGPPLPDLEVIIHDPNPETGEGEIWVRGDSVMQGYFHDEERTAEVLTEDGWFRTGDLGILDKDNYLFIKGRLKNMILGPSGENIYPEEIEAVINESDYVLESLVYQREGKLVARVYLNYEELDKELGTTGKSEAQARTRIESLLEDLRKHVNNRVSSFSRLNKIYEQAEPFEKTPTQKTKRYLYVN